MRKQIVLFIAASLDGYIATADHQLNWLMQVEGKDDNGYTDFLKSIDTIVMGTHTYDWLLTELGTDDFPYKEQRCIEFSYSRQGKDANVEYSNESPKDFIEHMPDDNGKSIWLVGGGLLIDTFLQQNLIDEWIITIAPTVLGNGIPLFYSHLGNLQLHLIAVKQLNQFVQLRYRTIR